ncbi:MAG: MaoC family dehydratase N-terminal domain-containing protein [Pseudomonadota bacterium]
MSDPFVGKSWTRTDQVSARLLQHFEMTLGDLVGGNGVPLGLHWCLAPDLAGPDDLGRDGHPRLGIFMPELTLPRRMWAGGELAIHGALKAGDEVTRTITIERVDHKTGSTGPLAFVTVRHLWRVAEETIIDEVQNVVYRDDPQPGDAPVVHAEAEPWPDGRTLTFCADPVRLFRYSALTFNGHRIHYDAPYATGIEGYEGLVVHGPLQATLMLNLAATVLGRAPHQFSYRGRAPLTAGTPARVEARVGTDDVSLRLVAVDSGVATMTATAR